MKCTDWNVSGPLTIRLKNFGIQQQALRRELLEAKHLGICKIIISEGVKPVFKNLDLTSESGQNTIRTDITLTREKSREIGSSTTKQIQGKVL